MHDDALTTPVDAISAAALAERGLRMVVIDPSDETVGRDWIVAVHRGFHDPSPDDEHVAETAGDFPLQRSVGVHDDAIAEPEIPVATVASWPAALTVPGGEVVAWAISDVTVAPTHRRKGIARAMLESELRVAVAGGAPLAMLTVSEATIYTRYGFGPATWSTDIAIESRRAGWLGAEAPGRLQFISRDTGLALQDTLFAEARRARVGDVQILGHRFFRLFGAAADPAEQRKRRFVRYDDEQGTPRGLVIYRLTDDERDFASSTAEVVHLVATTDDAYRALWQHVLSLDLVGTVKAQLRTIDEPLRWLVRDPRMIRTTELREHLWVRVLDPVVALGARSYAGAGRLGLRIADPLGHADGVFTIESDTDGHAVVTAEEPEDGPLLDLPVDALGSLYLGGASAVTLAAAGRLTERAPGDAALADRLLRAEVAPALMSWF